MKTLLISAAAAAIMATGAVAQSTTGSGMQGTTGGAGMTQGPMPSNTTTGQSGMDASQQQMQPSPGGQMQNGTMSSGSGNMGVSGAMNSGTMSDGTMSGSGSMGASGTMNGSTAMGGPMQAAGEYPLCTRTLRDRCMNPSEAGGMRSTTRSTRTRSRAG